MSWVALAVSDEIDPRVYSGSVKERMPDVDLVFGCGDVPARYLEFLVDALGREVYFVLGNHVEEQTRDFETGKPSDPLGCINLDAKVMKDQRTGILVGGLAGSPRYSEVEGLQFSEFQIYRKIARMIPRLTWNRVREGRWLDVLVTHAPARDLNDRQDVAHRGFKSLRWFLETFRPTYHLHGHVHLLDRREPNEVAFQETRIINVFPYQKITIDV